jgi:lysozyme
MTYSEEGLQLTEKFEGLRLKAYRDTMGVPTIGYGHTRDVTMDMTCTKEQARQWLQEDVQVAVDGVNRLVAVELTQNQFDALVDFTFNLGVGSLQRSTLLKLLNAGNYSGAAGEFAKWNKAGGQVLAGLTKRRQAERDLFNS